MGLKQSNQASDFELMVGCMKIKVYPFVANDKSTYTIIGFKAILRNPESQLTVSKRNEAIHQSINAIKVKETLN